MTKRNATPEEIERELVSNMVRWNQSNPNFQIPEAEWREKQSKAIEEGFKSEVCGVCHTVFLAFHHYTTCRDAQCPFSTGESIQATLQRSLDKDGTHNASN